MNTGTHARGDELDLRIEDLLDLDHHLPLLPRVAVLHEGVDVRNEVEGDALGKLLRHDLAELKDRLGLGEQFVHGVLPAPETD
jgi:hypothetical protein